MAWSTRLDNVLQIYLWIHDKYSSTRFKQREWQRKSSLILHDELFSGRVGIHFSRWSKLWYRFKSRWGKIYIFFVWLVFHRIFTLWLVSLYSQCLPIIASRDVCDYSVFLVRGSAEEVGFTVNRIPLNCYSSGPKDFHLFAPTFELVPRLETSRDSFSFSLVFGKSPENETAFAHSCLPPRYI